LADSKDIDTLSAELENRLDDLFSENDIPLTDAQDNNLKEYYPLSELKNLILSIDWEITDELLENLLQQLKDLQLTYEHDKIVMTFLQILSSLGNYIKSHRAQAHPKTFKILNSVFSSLDKVVLSKDMTEPEKKKILRAEMNRYKVLRAQIGKDKTAAAQHKMKTRPADTEVPEISEKKAAPIRTIDVSSQPPGADAIAELPITDPKPAAEVATLADAVEEIKRYFHTEIEALKEEIRSWRGQK